MAGIGTNGIAELLEKLVKIIKEEHVLDPSDRPVAQFVHPEELKKKVPIALRDFSESDGTIEMLIRQIIRYSVKTCSPHFHNQLFAGVDKYGLVGSWLTDVLNTSQYTYEVSPVFTLIEQEVIQRSLELVGYPPMPHADGIMNPGGSMSNMYGMVMARYGLKPAIKRSGITGLPPLVCFTSEDSHYSIVKGAAWLGLGTDNVYKVKTDKFGRMEPSDLRRAIAKARDKGHLPFFVNATCGTTVLGAFDPLPEIAAICQQENLWLHVDACLGGTLLLSEKYRHRLSGIELFVIITSSYICRISICDRLKRRRDGIPQLLAIERLRMIVTSIISNVATSFVRIKVLASPKNRRDVIGNGFPLSAKRLQFSTLELGGVESTQDVRRAVTVLGVPGERQESLVQSELRRCGLSLPAGQVL